MASIEGMRFFGSTFVDRTHYKMHGITDQYNRTFKVLRVSVINRCNLGCMYCVEHGDDAAAFRTQQQSSNLPANELVSIIAELHKLLDLETVRLTGGEP